MAIQPIDYSSAGLQALQGGLQTGLGLREASMRQQLFDQQLAEQEKQQQFGVALKSIYPFAAKPNSPSAPPPLIDKNADEIVRDVTTSPRAPLLIASGSQPITRSPDVA